MNDIERLMEVIEVSGRLRDGGTCTISANRQEVERHNLEGGLYYTFTRPEDGSKILYILEDGKGKKLGSKTKGMSMLHLITGTKSTYGYRNNDPFDNRQINMLSKRQAATYRWGTDSEQQHAGVELDETHKIQRYLRNNRCSN